MGLGLNAMLLRVKGQACCPDPRPCPPPVGAAGGLGGSGDVVPTELPPLGPRRAEGLGLPWGAGTDPQALLLHSPRGSGARNLPWAWGAGRAHVTPETLG